MSQLKFEGCRLLLPNPRARRFRSAGFCFACHYVAEWFPPVAARTIPNE